MKTKLNAFKRLDKKQVFQIAFGLDMDIHIVKNEAIKKWTGFTLSFGRVFRFFFPSKEKNARKSGWCILGEKETINCLMRSLIASIWDTWNICSGGNLALCKKSIYPETTRLLGSSRWPHWEKERCTPNTQLFQPSQLKYQTNEWGSHLGYQAQLSFHRTPATTWLSSYKRFCVRTTQLSPVYPQNHEK